MANQPSKRTNRLKPSEELMLTPLIDLITTMMFFFLIFASNIPVTLIDAPLPKIAATAEEVKKAKETDSKQELLVYVNMTGITVKSSLGGTKQFSFGPEGATTYKDLHEFLLSIHLKDPKARELTLIPDDDVIYDRMVSVMDAAREFYPGDPGFQQVPPEVAYKPEAERFNRMFPDVSIGGI